MEADKSFCFFILKNYFSVIFNPQILFFFLIQMSQVVVSFYIKGRKNCHAKMKISWQLAWDFAGYCGERISSKWCHVMRGFHHEQHFKVSCPVAEEVTDVYRWSTALSFVDFNSPSKRCAFFAISVIRIHIRGNYSLLYPWDLASWSLSCWRHSVCL